MCEVRIRRIGRCYGLQRRISSLCGSDGFALFAFRKFAKALSGEVEIPAHDEKEANQVSTLCRPDRGSGSRPAEPPEQVKRGRDPRRG